MHPVLIDVAGLTVSAYSVMVSAAIVLSVVLAVREGDRRGLPLSYGLGVTVVLGALVGARAFWILQFASPWRLWEALLVWRPGLVFYGGLIGGLATLTLELRWLKAPLLPCLDVAAPSVALGEGIARTGCFLAGCCWGRPSTLPWAVTFPAGSYAYGAQLHAGLIDAGAASALPVHPTQLYMAAGLAVAYILLRRALRRSPYPGYVTMCYLQCYGAVRFIVEMFRGDSARPLLGMTVSQAISLVLFLTGTVALLAASRHAEKRVRY